MTGPDRQQLLDELRTLRELLIGDEASIETPGTGDLFATSADRDRDAPDDPPGGSRSAPPADSDDACLDVPVLDDVVPGARAISVPADDAPAALRAGGEPVARKSMRESSGPERDSLDALLEDQWRDAAGTALDQARARIAENRLDWTPADTEALNQALKTRIDATVQDWIRTSVLQHIGALRDRLHEVIEAEAAALIDARLNQPRDHDSNHG